MSLQIEQQEKENREVKLTVQVDEARVDAAMHQVAKKYAKQLRIPGFRPGKAPFHIVRNWVGQEALRGEAVDSITQDIYKEALEQVDVEPYAPATLDDIEMDPLVLHLTVPLIPEVTLGNYRDVRIEPVAVSVEDAAVDKAVEEIQEAHVLLEPADRPCQEGDVVIADFKAVKDGDVLIERESAELLLDSEKLYPDIPFVENIVGLSAGDEKEFVVEIKVDEEEPEDDEAQAEDIADEAEAEDVVDEVEAEAAESEEEETESKDEPEQMTYIVKVHEVKSRFVPPINDDLAKEEGFESLLDMRINARDKLTEQAQKKADSEYVDKVFDAIQEGANVVYPQAALEMQIDQSIQELEQRFKQQGWSLEDYFKAQGKTPEMLREDLTPQAKVQLVRGQITRALVEAEKITVRDQDIDLLLEDRLNESGDYNEELRQQLREFYTAPDSRRWLANDAMMTKFTERLKAIGEGIAPELSELLDEEE